MFNGRTAIRPTLAKGAVCGFGDYRPFNIILRDGFEVVHSQVTLSSHTLKSRPSHCKSGVVCYCKAAWHLVHLLAGLTARARQTCSVRCWHRPRSGDARLRTVFTLFVRRWWQREKESHTSGLIPHFLLATVPCITFVELSYSVLHI